MTQKKKQISVRKQKIKKNHDILNDLITLFQFLEMNIVYTQKP